MPPLSRASLSPSCFKSLPPLGSLRRLLPLLFGLFLPGLAWADVKMPAIFGDHMVLQRDIGVPLWGWADPGETVTVTAGADKGTAVAGPDGQWTVKLDKLAASADPIDVTVTGKNTLTFHDVLVGDVWVCGGQSNMEFGIHSFITPDDLAKAGDPQIRLFTVPKWVAPIPEKDMAAPPTGFPCVGNWQVCTPETLVKTGEWSGFSAVGYYFGRSLRDYTHQPVGLISSNWGGTRIHSWISLDTLATLPQKVSATKGAENFRDNYDQIKQTYETVTLPQWNVTLAQWTKDNQAAIDAYDTAQKGWRQAVQDAVAQNQPPPPRPVAPKPPKAPVDPIHNNQVSCALFNGMISPLIPYGIKGAIWYQGEANALESEVYRAELPALIKDWRTHWNQGDFPFIVVQLPNFMARQADPGESAWASMREAQATALSLPNTGLVVTVDLGEAGNIHPADKVDVGQRLALMAQSVAYGQQDAVSSGPTYKSFAVEGNKVRILFDHVGGGLAIGTAPEHYYLVEKQPVPAPAAALTGFAVAGADNKFVWANSVIDGNSVVVNSDAVPAPVSVRYAWADNPACNLYNKEGLPAMPFRTDSLPLNGK